MGPPKHGLFFEVSESLSHCNYSPIRYVYIDIEYHRVIELAVLFLFLAVFASLGSPSV